MSRHYFKSFNPYMNDYQYYLSFGDEETGTERLSNLLKVTQLVIRVLGFVSRYITTKSCKKTLRIRTYHYSYLLRFTDDYKAFLLHRLTLSSQISHPA